ERLEPGLGPGPRPRRGGPEGAGRGGGHDDRLLRRRGPRVLRAAIPRLRPGPSRPAPRPLPGARVPALLRAGGDGVRRGPRRGDRIPAPEAGTRGARDASPARRDGILHRPLGAEGKPAVKLSIVMPAYNEEKTIKEIVGRVKAVDLGP